MSPSCLLGVPANERTNERTNAGNVVNVDDYHVVLSHGSGEFIPAFMHALSRDGGPIELTSNTDTVNPNNYYSGACGTANPPMFHCLALPCLVCSSSTVVSSLPLRLDCSL
eukprot:SAG22_NODE_2513_length_2489_cov_3.750628_3_plen_111_part_00